MSNGTNIVAESLSNGSRTGFSVMHQSSIVTSESLTNGSLPCIEAWLKSFPQVSPASPSLLPERDKAIRMNETCGLPQSSAFAWYDPSTSCWRTFQLSLLTNTCDEFTETWPKAGIIRNGVAYRRLKWESSNEIDGGVLLPSPTVRGNYNRKGASPTSGDGFATAFKKRFGYFPEIEHYEMAMGLPVQWTEIKPLQMDKFRQWLRQFGDC